MATAPVMFSLFTVKYACLLCQQSGVALYLPDFAVDVSACVVAAGDRDAYTLKRAHSGSIGCYWNVIMHGNKLDYYKLTLSKFSTMVDYSPL